MDKNKKKKGGVYVEERWVLKSFVDNMKEEGYTIKQLLGHTSIHTTARYLRLTKNRLIETKSPLDLLNLPKLLAE